MFPLTCFYRFFLHIFVFIDNSDMMPSAINNGNYKCEVIMFIRIISALFFCCLASTPALAEVKSSTDKVVDTFMELDLDESETVSFKEYQSMVNERAQTRFEEMDANADEEISDEEYRDFWRENKAKWYRLQR